jgi:hypothetical protein
MSDSNELGAMHVATAAEDSTPNRAAGTSGGRPRPAPFIVQGTPVPFFQP